MDKGNSRTQKGGQFIRERRSSKGQEVQRDWRVHEGDKKCLEETGSAWG